MSSFIPRRLMAIQAVGVIMLFMVGPSIAGSLEPSGPPAPTMKSLDKVTPSWSNVIADSSKRFEVLASMGDSAVLDHETGLVWMRNSRGAVHFGEAISNCYGSIHAGKGGWRLPTVYELKSLLILAISSTGSGITLIPDPHPFGILPRPHWSITKFIGADGQPTGDYYAVDFNPTIFSSTAVHPPLTNGNGFICVRGGQ